MSYAEQTDRCCIKMEYSNGIYILQPQNFHNVSCFAALKVHVATQKFRAKKHVQGIFNLEPPFPV